MQKNILIIDDDVELNNLLKTYLERNGHKVKSATSPIEGIEIVFDDEPDLLILDVMMPEMDGFEVCKAIRQKSNIPIIMLTARGDVTDRIVGLEMGADDYLPKPFEPRELDARIKTILRRLKGNQTEDKQKIGDITLFPNKFIAKLNEDTLDLSSFEFELLQMFVQNKGRVLSRDSIMDHLKGNDWAAFDRSIDMQISRLRQKLGDDPKKPRYIKTIRGVGYIFIDE